MAFRAQFNSREAALEQRHQSRVPIAKNKQQEKRNGEVVVDLDGVISHHREIAANQQLHPRDPSQPPAVFCGAYLIFFRADIIFRGARESSFFSDERFDNGFRVRNGESDTKSHQKR